MGSLVLLLVTDLANRATTDPFRAKASYWLAIVGLVTGWLGGEMVFRHQIGVTGAAARAAHLHMQRDRRPGGVQAARR